MLSLVLSLSLAAKPVDFEGRVQALQWQLERLAVIQVPAELTAEKEAKLKELKTELDSESLQAEDLNAFYTKLDGVRSWLLDNAVPRPSMPDGDFMDFTEAWVLRNPELTLEVKKADLSLTVKTPEETWHFPASATPEIELRDGSRHILASARRKSGEAFNTGYSVGFLMSLSDFPGLSGFALEITFNLIGKELILETAASKDLTNLALLTWPGPVETGNTAEDVAVIPNSQGLLMPGNWPQELHKADLTNSRTLYMPWWGQIRNGHGIQTILETSDDGGVEYRHPAGGPTWFQPRWYSSLGGLRYPRVMRYVFDDASTYVRMAKRFRRYVMETGRFVSLEEKRVRTPNLNEVIGRPVVYIGTLSHHVPGSRFYREEYAEQNHRLSTFEQQAEALRQLKASGIDDAYVHLDGWGFRGYDNVHPDVVPPGPEQGGWEGMRKFADTCDELGYIFAVHDQYRDYYLNAVSFDERLAVRKYDGTRDEHAEWAGGKQTFLSAWFAPGYVRRNHDAFAANGVKVRGAYLDVFAVVPLEESFASHHPVTRTDCARYRRECCDLLRARGYVVSSEEPADYLIGSLDLVHHGPYATWPKGYGQGAALGIPVPLFNLVYHDSLLTPWYQTEDGGFGIPDGDAGWLHCRLNAGLPYVGPGSSPEQVAQVKEAAALAMKLGTREMVNHEFLDEARRVQRTTYSDGTTVTVDFDKKTVEVK